MAPSNRADSIAKLFKGLKKNFKSVSLPERPVLEQLLFACCLENTDYSAAEEAFARLQESFYDWNEIRVTTVRELSEMLAGVADPQQAAANLKHTLHSVFESIYEFSLESLKKQNLGVAVKQLEKYRGTTPFTIAFVAQNSLGGHSIPICKGSLDVLYIVGVISEEEWAKGLAPGLERAVSKSNGHEFASLLHQMGAMLVASPFSSQLKKLLLEIEPDAKARLPKRITAKSEPVDADETKTPASTSKKKTAKKATETKSTDGAKASTKKTASKTPDKKATKKTAPEAKAKKKTTKKKTASKQLSRKKPR
ncbi:MAG: hypothetical protein R3C28_16660 [Pirellulaceae bacterium]